MCVCLCSAAPTMWGDGLRRLGWVSHMPRGQSAVRVAADKVFTLVVPSDRVDRLRETGLRYRMDTRTEALL